MDKQPLETTPPMQVAQTGAIEQQSAPCHIGLLAGWGGYPIAIVEALKRQGCRVSCLGVKDHADPALIEMCDDFEWIGLAKLGAAIRYFRRRGVQRATMAGKFHKVLIYQPWIWLKHFPDWRFLRAMYPHFITGRGDRKDDTLLGAIADAFAADGITFAPATDFAPELLVRSGSLTGRGPSPRDQRDIEFGWQMAKRLGELDIGQSVCVKDQAVLAVEAIEGTDQCIQRAGTLCLSGGFTIVKVAKPQQDMRFDVPTIGLQTLETMVAAGARVLAVEAERTILLDEPAFVQFAIDHRLTVVALSTAGRAERAA